MPSDTDFKINILAVLLRYSITNMLLRLLSGSWIYLS